MDSKAARNLAVPVSLVKIPQREAERFTKRR
jgi:hypothetical protein